METGVFHVFIITCVIASALAARVNMHMFQLNGYNLSAHGRWIAKNSRKLWPQALMLFALLLYLLHDHVMIKVSLAVLAVLLCFPNLPGKPAKKPLVFTARVIRMFAVIALIHLLIIGAAFYVPARHGYIFMGLAYVAASFWPLFACLINMPVEAAVRRYYIADAKKILKSHPNLIVIGITGSFGKTSVKYFLTTILRARYDVLMTPESYNTPMGITRTIREQLRATHEIFVCEMGARRRGEIKELCEIVSPVHGIITSVGEQHLETQKTIANILQTKFELAASVAGKGMLFLNGDNELIRSRMPDEDCRTYGLGADNDFSARDIRVTPEGTAFSLSHDGGTIADLQTRLIGGHNVANVAAAIAVGVYLGVPLDMIRAQLRKISPPPHRLALSRHGGMTIIDDTYNSNPAGCAEALNALSLFTGHKILITPGMVELGTRQDALNHVFGKQAAAVCDLVILVGEKQTKAIWRGLTDAGYDPAKIAVVESFPAGMEIAHSCKNEGQRIVLLENDLPDNY